MMSNDVLKVEIMPESCCICGLAGELATPEEYDAASGSAAPLRTALLQLNNNKVVPEGRLCGSCAQRAIDAHDFSTSLSSRTAVPLSEKIRALRRRLHDLTQKIDVFIVVGGPGASGTYSEEDIIMVERSSLSALSSQAEDQQPLLTNARGDHVYQCSVCPMSFPSVGELEQHTGSHPPDAAHCCWSCGEQFPRADLLREHSAQHQLLHNTCHLCQTTYQSASELRAHQAGPLCGPCPACGEAPPSRAALAAHAGAHPAMCPACFLQLPGEQALAGHLVLHRAGRRYVCAVGDCVLRFPRRELLLAHLRAAHRPQLQAPGGPGDQAPRGPGDQAPRGPGDQAPRGPGDQTTCQVCGRTFASPAALKRHARVHRNDEQEQLQETLQEQEQEYAPEQTEGTVEYQWEGVEGEEVEYLEIETLEEEIVE